jgi:Protein of unknown function (DUF3617)
MRTKISVALAVVVSLVWIQNASAEVKEGQWEITTKVEMPGMPVAMPATTMKQCINKKDMVPKPQRQPKGQECTMKDQTVTGDTVTYTMECKSEKSTVLTNGKMTYKGDSFEGTSDTTIQNKGQPGMKMTSTMTGKYLGPCPKEK